jgi:hypothetical protein
MKTPPITLDEAKNIDEWLDCRTSKQVNDESKGFQK